MAGWPGNEKNNRVKGRNNLSLEQGLIGAATLLEKNKKFEWRFATTESRRSIGSSTSKLSLGKHVEIFPPTRPTPLRQVSTTINQHAEHGANFLRTYFPDIDIPAELVRDQLVEEITLARELERSDPYAGNLLGVHNTQNASLLFFPMGETYRELNISTAKFGHDFVFKPSTISSYTFPAPIQHIEIAKSDELHPQDIRVAVRTYGFTKLLKLDTRSEFDSDYKLTDLATLSRANMGDEVMVDMKHLHSSYDVLAVGDRGAIYQWHISDRGKDTTLICRNGRKTCSTVNDCHFWRLSLDPRSSSYFLMSNKDVVHGDARVNRQPPNEILSIENGKHLLTSIENLHQDGLLRLCSTNQIIWIDPRMAGKHLLTYCHDRQYDQDLATETFSRNSNDVFTLLKSRKNGLITVYDVSRSQDGLVSVNTAPYALSTGTSLYDKHDGQGIVVHSHGFGVVRLSERGRLSYNALAFDASGGYAPVVEWTTALEELRTTTILHTDVYQDRPQVDLFRVYNVLFRTHYEDARVLEESADATYDLLESFSSYWQTKDMPVEHVLTTYDIIFRAGNEPKHASRADFLTGSVINSSIGYRALKQGRLSAEAIKAPWHRSIALTLSHLDKGFQVDSKKWTEYLQQFDLRNTSTVSSQTYRNQYTARQQLEVDLALSTDVFSEIVLKPDSVDHTLEVMTEALSLSDEPPPIEFGYLRPLERKHNTEESEVGEVLQTPDIPMGVRLLLNNWGSGTPESYFYQDPYDNSGTVGRIKPPTAAPSVQDFVARRPPHVMASKQADMPNRIFQSQEAPFRHVGSSMLQDLVSTQILPGPYGGRPSVSKKPVKKRLGGF